MLHYNTAAFGPHQVLHFPALDRRLSHLSFPAGRLAVLVGEAWVQPLHILGDLELTLRDKVYILYGRLTLNIDLLPAEVLPFAQIVVDPGDRVRSQPLKYAVIFELLHDPLHLSSLFFAYNHGKVEAGQTCKTSVLRANDGCSATLVVLKRQIPKILPAFQRVDSLESLDDDFIFVVWVHHLEYLVVDSELATAMQLLEEFVSLVSVKTALFIDLDRVLSELLLDHLLNACLSLDRFPVNVVVVLNEEVEQTDRRRFIFFQLDWQRHPDIDLALDHNIEMIARVPVLEDYLSRLELLKPQILAQLLVRLFVPSPFDLLKKGIVLEQLLGLSDLGQRARLGLK